MHYNRYVDDIMFDCEEPMKTRFALIWILSIYDLN
jgi:hypothetical protein